MKRNPQGSGTIRQRKDGTWEARYISGVDTATGKGIRKSIYGKTQKEVRQKLTAAIRALDTGTYTEATKITVSQWLDIWLNEYVENSVKPFTYKSYETQIRVHIKPAFGAVKLQVLNVPTVQKFYNNMLKNGLSPKTIKNVHGVLHKALEKAVSIGYININPAAQCELPRIEKKEIQPFTDDDIKAFMYAIEHEEYKNLLLVTLFTGLREGEVMGLTWDCIDFKNGTVTVNKQLQKEKKVNGKYILSSTKNSETRVLTPASFVMDWLKDESKRQGLNRLRNGFLWDNEFNLVFTNDTGRHLAFCTVYKHFKKIAISIGLPDARFHDLRHTYAVTALQEGDNIKTVQGNLGHATAAFTLDVYGHVSEKMKRESAERMEKYIKNIK
ncbi:MAG: site-specific integrase [Clostridia bacterium]|nr:site-specific integrase [Clostridia bacterium]